MGLRDQFISNAPAKPIERVKAAVEMAKERAGDIFPRKGRPSSGKVVVSIRLDPDVVQKFRATGPGWQSRVNAALKAAKV